MKTILSRLIMLTTWTTWITCTNQTTCITLNNPYQPYHLDHLDHRDQLPSPVKPSTVQYSQAQPTSTQSRLVQGIPLLCTSRGPF